MTRKPLNRSKKLMRKSWLKPASKKRKGQYSEYAKVKKAYLSLHPTCERCKSNKSQDIHHKAQRHGNLLTKWELFAALCRPCHDWVHSNGREARKLGWIVDAVSYHGSNTLSEEQ